MKIQKTKYHSFKIGNFAEGCKFCVKGEKLVLFITGICPRKCWYCPIADNKVQNDVIYANESKILSIQEAIIEAKLCNSKGMGITGGDPLTKLGRCIEYIKALKKEFGENFHIHLYTSLMLINEENLKKLHESGLDEIRFHPDFSRKEDWNKISIARRFNWKIGIEIPCIPDMVKETISLIEFFKDKVDFINLNELEAADSESNEVFSRGYKSRSTYSYGILGSEGLAFKLMKKYSNLNMHFCTSKLKNIVQLENRIKLRANGIKKSYDILTKNGSLIRGAIYLKKPFFGHIKSLETKDKYKELINLGKLRNKIITEFNISKDYISIDPIKYRILSSKAIVTKNKDKLKMMGLFPAIVEELATGDLFEIEVKFL